MSILLLLIGLLMGVNSFLWLHNRKLWKHNQALAEHNAALDRRLTVLKNIGR